MIKNDWQLRVTQRLVKDFEDALLELKRLPQFPVSDIPMQEIGDKAANLIFKAKPAKVYKFADIRNAHELMESNQANGKMVIVI